jgi:hypothetical protein
MPYKVQQSEEIVSRHIKIMLWGPTGSRKTELVLRNFPSVLLIDSEGNSEQCVGVKEIKPFARVQTKDCRLALEVVNDAAAGKIKVAKQNIETLCFDSASVMWSVQQEVANTLAEKRATRYNKPAEEATNTQLDWVVAKRPQKKLYTAANNSPFRFLVFIAREKDFYKEDPSDKKKVIKDGYTWDAMKGIDYEVNLALHLGYDENGKWQYTVTKVQGALGKLFPMGSTKGVFPIKELLAYAETIAPTVAEEKDEDQIADEQATAETTPKPVHSQTALIAYARENFKLEPKDLGAILKAAGISDFKPELWDRCITAFKDHLAQV